MSGTGLSAQYYQGRGGDDDQSPLDVIEQILVRWPFYGYRRVQRYLK